MDIDYTLKAKGLCQACEKSLYEPVSKKSYTYYHPECIQKIKHEPERLKDYVTDPRVLAEQKEIRRLRYHSNQQSIVRRLEGE